MVVGVLDKQLAGWKEVFWKVNTIDGNYFVVEEGKDGIVTKRPHDSYFINKILKFSFQYTGDVKAIPYFNSHKRCLSLRQHWAGWTTKQIEEEDIKSVAFKSDKGLCWHRLDFDATPREVDLADPFKGYNCPTWERMLSRGNNIKAYMATIGSLFYEQANLQQYLFLYGKGRNGKGSSLRFLKKLFGPAYKGQSTEQKVVSSNFFTYGLLGARVAAFSDISNVNFLKSETLKQITGGDSVRLEPKGKAAFDAILRCRCIFASNDKPSISGAIADTRRAIFCEFQPVPEDEIDEENFENWLWEERAEFISLCMAIYRKMCPGFQSIPVEKEVTAALVEDSESEMQSFFDQHFILDEEGRIGNAVPGEVLRRNWKGNVSDFTISEFKKFLERMPGVELRRVSVGKDRKANEPGRPRMWCGVRLKQAEDG